jgi:hypothetical protein
MKNLVNFILFQMLWVACVLGAANQIIWPSIILVIAMLVTFSLPAFKVKNDIFLVFICLILGFILDSSLAYFNFIDYSFDYGYSLMAPLWILLLWIGFALTLNHSMAWIFKNIKLGYLLMAVGAPLSYISADRLGAVTISNIVLTSLIVSLSWVLVFTVLILIKKNQQTKARYEYI